MAVQERQLTKHHQDREQEQVTSTQQNLRSKTQQERGEDLKREIDGLLDDIDAVLESDAEEFVRGYVQKGGQ